MRAVLDEVSTAIHGGGAAVNVINQRPKIRCIALCVPGTAHDLKSESSVMNYKAFDKS